MEWNKVSNGLPENMSVVDIWLSIGERVTDATYYSDDQMFYCDFGDDYDLTEVTHWRFGDDIPKD